MSLPLSLLSSLPVSLATQARLVARRRRGSAWIVAMLGVLGSAALLVSTSGAAVAETQAALVEPTEETIGGSIGEATGEAGNAETNHIAAPSAWQARITDRDRRRLRDWYDIWSEAIAEARAQGYDSDLAAAGSLLVPFPALQVPAIVEGRYRCRIFKIGRPTGRADGKGFAVSEWLPCDISAIAAPSGSYRLQQPQGAQRLNGTLYADTGNRRYIFLGTRAFGYEKRELDYGEDRLRDQVGIFQQINETHWRILLPTPAFEAQFHIVEIASAS